MLNADMTYPTSFGRQMFVFIKLKKTLREGRRIVYKGRGIRRKKEASVRIKNRIGLSVC